MPSRASFCGSCLVLLVLVQTCSSFSHGMSLHPALRGGQIGNQARSIAGLRRNMGAPKLRTALKMVMPVDHTPIEQVIELASMTPAVATILYQKAVLASPATFDAATATGLYYLGQRAKGVISKSQPTWDTLARWMVVGVVDGLTSHLWYTFLDNNFSGIESHVLETIVMAVFSGIIYTPAYCAGFLGLLSLLEGKGLSGAQARLQSDWLELTKATVSSWGLFNFFLFGFIELDQRVTCAMTMHFLYLIVLALWAEGKDKSRVAVPVAVLEEPTFATIIQEDLADFGEFLAGDAGDRLGTEIGEQLVLAEELIENVAEQVAEEFVENVANPYNAAFGEEMESLDIDLEAAVEAATEAVTEAISGPSEV